MYILVSLDSSRVELHVLLFILKTLNITALLVETWSYIELIK